jgi:hypothetical protein
MFTAWSLKTVFADPGMEKSVMRLEKWSGTEHSNLLLEK